MPFIVQRRVGGDQQVKEHQGKTLRLGRGTNVDVRFDDPGIDYEHAVIEHTPFGFVLRDLGGQSGRGSGVWVNGERVERAELQEGDRIDLGSFEINARISGFGDYLFLYLEIEELGADDATSLSGLHSMTMSFASRELHDLARQARERHEAEQRSMEDAPTAPMKTVESSPDGQGAVGSDRPPSEVSASHILNLFSESGLDLRESFADFDQSLRDSIAQTRQIRTVKAEPETQTSSAPPPTPDEAETTTPPSMASLPPPDLPEADGWSTSLLDDEGSAASEPVAGTPEPVPAAPVPAAPVPAAPVPDAPEAPESKPRREEPAGIDYVKVYGLPGGLGVAWSLALVMVIFGLGAASLTALRHTELLSPGPLGGQHADAEGLTCASCHTGFVGVEEQSCMRCHERIQDHQQVMADERGCMDCHLEHRGGDALRLADTTICVSCHSSLSETQAAAGKFADQITEFSKDHPEFAVYVDSERRVRLDTREARSSDPGGLKGFDHFWHMEKLPKHLRRSCTDCHRQDEAGEIVPIDFEVSCRECHQLAFDPRFPGEETPHDTPTVVTGFLVGHYVGHREILRQLTGRERRLGGGSLSAEERLTLVAEAVAERTLRDRCDTCHVLSRAPEDRGKPTQVEVKPVRITERWFPHAVPFPHGQHVELTQCSDCHALATGSRETSDLILPSLVACKTCHRPAEDDEREPDRLARSTCRTCHSFHATPVEVRTWQTAEMTSP